MPNFKEKIIIIIISIRDKLTEAGGKNERGQKTTTSHFMKEENHSAIQPPSYFHFVFAGVAGKRVSVVLLDILSRRADRLIVSRGQV